MYVHGSTTDGAYIGTDHSDLERFCDTPDSVYVLGEEVSGKSDFSVIGEFLLISVSSHLKARKDVR